MSQVPETFDEVSDSLTGFDEMEIAQQFGRTLQDLGGDRSMLYRAVIFVAKRRGGMNDDEARNAALSMALKDVMSFFAEESEESGKDEPEAELSPETSPPGASEPDEPETSTSPSPESNGTPSSTLRLAGPVEELPAS